MIRKKRMIALTIALTAMAGCAYENQSCRGITSAAGVASAGPVIAAFRAHLKGYESDSELDSYFRDVSHYDLAITTSDSTFEYEFIPQTNGKNYKGGGAVYLVSRETGQIVRTEYLK